MNLIINKIFLCIEEYLRNLCIELNMKNKETLLNANIINTCQLPKDVIWGASIISITGTGELTIENFKGIIKYHPELIIIQCKNYQVNIIGDNLIIEMYTKEEVKVTGTIFEIKFS